MITDSIDRRLRDLHFEVPIGLVERAKRAAARDLALADHDIGNADRLRGVRLSGAARPSLATADRSSRLMAFVAAALALAVIAGLVLAAHAVRSVRPTPSAKPQGVVLPATYSSAPKPGTAYLPVSGTSFFGRDDAAVSLEASLVSYAPTVMTRDGGATWSATPLGKNRSASDWLDQNIRWIDSQHVVAILAPFGSMDRTLISTSSDGGHSWHSVMLDFWQLPSEMFFLNSHEGWLLCGAIAPCDIESQTPSSFDPGAIYHTTDAGLHWLLVGRATPQAPTNQSGESLPVSPTRIYFTDSTHGFVTACYANGVGRLLSTDDGGQSWRQVNLSPPPGGWAVNTSGSDGSACEYLPSMFGKQGVLVIEDGSKTKWFAYTTSDGGRSWAKPRLLPFPEYAVVPPQYTFVSPDNWWAFFPGGPLEAVSVSRTTDGGQTWRSVEPSPPAGYVLASVNPVGGGVLWGTARVDGNGWMTLVRSTDDGATWSLVKLPDVCSGGCAPQPSPQASLRTVSTNGSPPPTRVDCVGVRACPS